MCSSDLLNISYDHNEYFSALAKLIYNGTEHRATELSGGFFSTTFDIPLISSGESELKDFYWKVDLFDGSGIYSQNSTTKQQNVSKIHLEECGGAYTTKTLNFTAYDEQNLTRINPYRFDGTFYYWLGSGSIRRNNSFSKDSTAEEVLCIKPTNETNFIDGQVDYNEPEIDPLNMTYTARNYFFQNDTINNVTQEIPLYLLKSDDSTSFILKVQDNSLVALSEYLIYTERFYAGENVYRTVQVAKTDEEGKSIGFFQTETTDYRFIIKHNGRIELTTNPQKIVGESAPFTITFTIGGNQGPPWGELEEVENLEYSLNFNKTTNTITFNYVDTSEGFNLGRLVVQKQNYSSFVNINICNINSTQPSATIICNLTGNSTGSYTAWGLITRDGEEKTISIKNFLIETISNIIGLLGVFLGFFIILISAFAFKFNEIAGIFMIDASVIFVNLIGLINFGLLGISALIAVSIIIVGVLKR